MTLLNKLIQKWEFDFDSFGCIIYSIFFQLAKIRKQDRCVSSIRKKYSFFRSFRIFYLEFHVDP